MNSGGDGKIINPTRWFQGESGACSEIIISNRSSSSNWFNIMSGVVLGLPVAGSVSSKRLERREAFVASLAPEDSSVCGAFVGDVVCALS